MFIQVRFTLLIIVHVQLFWSAVWC